MPKTADPALSTTGQPPRGLALGLFLSAMAVLLLAVALTRGFAILMWHHLAYMVISLALLGFGASGSLLTVFPIARQAERVPKHGAAYAALFGLGIAGAFFTITRLRVDSLEIWNRPENFASLLLTFVILSVPFIFAGLTIGLSLTRYPAHIGRLYFTDLAGSALGGAVAPSLLGELGSTTTVMIAAALAGIGGLAYATPESRGRRWVHAAIATFLVLVAVGFATQRIKWDVPFAPHKDVIEQFPDRVSDSVLHSAVAQVDVSKPKVHTMAIGGHFGDIDWSYAELRGVTQDGTAPTVLYKNASDIRSFKALDDSQAASAYIVMRERQAKDLDILAIGCGGGVDVMTALYFDQEPTSINSVTAVDINKAMIRAVTETYAEYIGRLFDHPKVKLVHAEGRSYLRRSGRKFDIIQLSGVDTFTALNTGAYTLSESYLYTTEAVQDFYNHLEEGGIVNYSRFLDMHPRKARETIRLANIAYTALERLGVAEPWRHIAVLQAHGWASTMIKKGPFTEAEMAALHRFADAERFMGMVFDPVRPMEGPFDRGRAPSLHYEVAATQAMSKAASSLFGNVSPGEIGAHKEAFVTPVQEVFRAAHEGDLPRSDQLLAEFLYKLPADLQAKAGASLRESRSALLELREKIGNHFVAQQKDFTRLLRGSPAERAAFIRDYDYDLSPSADDRPFFFDYFRLSRFMEYWRKRGDWSDEYHPDFPVGHGVLLASLLQIAFLALVLILLPLGILKRRGTATPRRLRTFVYFGALGLGFMFLEIGLMQKFTLFLGHPTYSLSVVLSGMLFFSGLGAYYSSRLTPSRSTYLRLLLILLALVGVELLALSHLLDTFLGHDFLVRAAIVLALLAPVGFLLGMPFPLGMRLLETHAPSLVPWGWAINGFLSVFASISSIFLAMNIGFTMLILVAAGIYTFGFLLAPLPPRSQTA